LKIKIHSNKFLKKDWTFDFIYLFLILITGIFLISTYLLFNKPLFEADDLKLLRTPEKLLMVVIVIPIIEEFSMRGLFVVIIN
jgi:membrane protease YdiL (CAAX protease family)